MKLSDGVAAGVDEEERKYGVDETGKTRDQHATAEGGSMDQVLGVGFTDGSRMGAEYPGEFHAQRLLAAPG